MTPVLYAIFGVIGTFFFLVFAGGFLYFVVELMKTIRAATKALEALGPALKGEELVRLSNAIVLMGKLGTQMLQKMDALDKTIDLFYKFAVSRRDLEAAAQVGNEPTARSVGGGNFYTADEERSAAREAAEVANKVRTE